MDVAREAGVSKATVSKVLNGRQDLSVRPETRQRVHEVAAALGYRPHSGAPRPGRGQHPRPGPAGAGPQQPDLRHHLPGRLPARP
ncbi:LacI family DNA-binding transcriptional regulator [Streptomyces sp. L7]